MKNPSLAVRFVVFNLLALTYLDYQRMHLTWLTVIGVGVGFVVMNVFIWIAARKEKE